MNEITKIENRIASLARNPVTNAKLIKKWQRKLRHLKEKEVC